LIFLASFFASRQRMKWACLAADRASGQSPGKAKFQEYFLFRHFLSSQKVTKPACHRMAQARQAGRTDGLPAGMAMQAGLNAFRLVPRLQLNS
jgi:hypothetical protein